MNQFCQLTLQIDIMPIAQFLIAADRPGSSRRQEFSARFSPKQPSHDNRAVGTGTGLSIKACQAAHPATGVLITISTPIFNRLRSNASGPRKDGRSHACRRANGTVFEEKKIPAVPDLAAETSPLPQRAQQERLPQQSSLSQNETQEQPNSLETKLERKHLVAVEEIDGAVGVI